MLQYWEEIIKPMDANYSTLSLEAVISRIRETPNGTSVADFLEKTLKGKSSNVPVNSRTGVNGPKKFGKKLFSSVTSKIQIPEKSLTTEEIKRQVELGISSLSFCRAVAEVLQERKRKFHQESFALSSSDSSLSSNFYRELDRTVHKEGEQTEKKIRDVESEFCKNTEWLLAGKRNDSGGNKGTAERTSASELFDALKEVVIEREILKQDYPAEQSDNSVNKRPKNLMVLQSRIDFRSTKLLESGLSLHPFVKDVLFGLSQPQSSLAKDEISTLMKTADASVQEYVSNALAVSGKFDDLLTATEIQHAKSRALDEELMTLKERAIKDREKIVKQLNKISFGMRLDLGIETMTLIFRRDFCDILLKRVSEELIARDTSAVPPQIDPVTGFEIPYCALSEAQLEVKVKELHVKLDNRWSFMNDFMEHSVALEETSRKLRMVELPAKLNEAKIARQSFTTHSQHLFDYLDHESTRAKQLTTHSSADMKAVEGNLILSTDFVRRTHRLSEAERKLPDFLRLQDDANRANALLSDKNIATTVVVDKISATLGEIVKLSETTSQSSSSDERFFDHIYTAQSTTAFPRVAAGDGKWEGRPVTSTPFAEGRREIVPLDFSMVLNLDPSVNNAYF